MARWPAAPRVYVYNIANFTDPPPTFAHAFGAQLDAALYDTPQHTMARMLHWRLMRSRHRVSDAAQANIFFVPLLEGHGAKPLDGDAMRKECRRQNLSEAAVRPRLHALRSPAAACGHVFAVGKQFDTPAPCTWWSNPRDPLLRQATRLAYSHPLTGWHGSREDELAGYVKRFLAEPERLGENHYPHVFSIPYPSSVHWSTSLDPHVAPWARRGARPTLMLFLGSTEHGDVAVRHRIKAQCEGLSDRSACTLVSYDSAESVRLMANATFCLQPGGDSPVRKSLTDAITHGCIPVLFSPFQDAFLPWWRGWQDARVLIPRGMFVSDRVDLRAFLAEIAADPVRLSSLQSALERHARSLQISVDDDPSDALGVILASIRARCSPLDQTDSPA